MALYTGTRLTAQVWIYAYVHCLRYVVLYDVFSPF